MKIVMTKENLLFGVSSVQKAVSVKSTLPILTCIKMEAKNNLVYFFATDLDIGIQCHIPADVVFEGAVVVPARHFAEIVRKLPDTLITLQLVDKNQLLIQYQNSELSLRTMDAAEFPNMPEMEGEHEINIQSGLLKQMIKQTVFAAGTDEGRPLFTGVLFETEEGLIRMIATDTHRLALRQGQVSKANGSSLSFILPSKILTELSRLIYEEDGNCTLSISKNLCIFNIENIVIICRLLDGQFPNYRQVIPGQYKSRVITKNKVLQEAVDRISLFTMNGDSSNTIHLKTKDGLLTVFSQSDLGQGYEQVEMEIEGEDVEISFNARYLADVFKIIDSEMAILEFTGPLSPCIVRPQGSENFLYLVLPVRS